MRAREVDVKIERGRTTGTSRKKERKGEGEYERGEKRGWGRYETREVKRSRKDKAAQNVPLRHLKSFFSVENLSFCKRRRTEK